MIRDQVRLWGTVFAALLGLAFGSFLNVCLSRWPEGESIVNPRSHCRMCGRNLAWWENVPLLSWIALRGRCRGCDAWIGWRYVVVEAAVGALWAETAWRSLGWIRDSTSPHFDRLTLLAMGARFILYWLLIALAVLDAENFWLPDLLTWPGIILGTTYSLLPYYVIDRLPLFGIRRASLSGLAIRSVIASMVAAAIILVIHQLYRLIRRLEGIGLGDAKLMAMLGAWLGFPGALLAFGLGVVLGAVVAFTVLGIPARQSGRQWGLLKMPMGTFLCVGGIVSALWGQQIIAAYLRWAGF